MGFGRIVKRVHYESQIKSLCKKNGRRALIYGTNSSARILVKQFFQEQEFKIWPVGYVDNSLPDQDTHLDGLIFIGLGQDLAQHIRNHSIQELIIAKYDLSGVELQSILQVAHEFHIRPRILTNQENIDKQSQSLQLFRDVELEDLLPRPKIEVDQHSIVELVTNKTVLVTGAGGSIGSELARQILLLKPKLLLLVDNSEFNLYKIDQTLGAMNRFGVKYLPLLIDLKEADELNLLVLKYKPEVVYHAAAYKHVHLVEANPLAGIRNNVMGTKNLLNAVASENVDHFVMISSDKAVNPVGLMGATKRVCELLVTDFALTHKKHFCSVRFGNVLGSSGSFIPLLKQQIRDGGPVTITHKDMARYFMMISEAVSLVLKASSIAKPGEIHILRMGEPIRILDIAKNLITLLGKKKAEIPIVFTGLRPGEKMVEELYLCGNEIKTSHPDILVLPKGDDSNDISSGKSKELIFQIDSIIKMALNNDQKAVSDLFNLVRLHSRVVEEENSNIKIA